MGALGTQLRSAIAPIARSLVADVGRSTVQLKRAAITRAADNSEIRTWQVVTGGDALDAPILEPTEEALIREWGADPAVTAVAVLPDTVAVIVNDGIIVTAGDHAGEHFRVVAVHPKPMAGLQRVALETTQERFS